MVRGARGWRGISSGEGLIAVVRDGCGDGDEGETDKRLLVVEPEFARGVLAVAVREGSIVSHVIRDAWSTGTLRNLTKRDPVKATGADISIIGHITAEELTRPALR